MSDLDGQDIRGYDNKDDNDYILEVNTQSNIQLFEMFTRILHCTFIDKDGLSKYI